MGVEWCSRTAHQPKDCAGGSDGHSARGAEPETEEVSADSREHVEQEELLRPEDALGLGGGAGEWARAGVLLLRWVCSECRAEFA